MRVETRYGNVRITHHAVERWVERTGRSLDELVAALSCANRPTKQQLRRINKRRIGMTLRRILECDVAYFIIVKKVVVTVYQKEKHMELQRSFTTPHSYSALEKEIEMAEALIENDGTAFPDCTFEDGYIACMKFVLGHLGSNVREEYEDMLSERNNEEDAA